MAVAKSSAGARTRGIENDGRGARYNPPPLLIPWARWAFSRGPRCTRLIRARGNWKEEGHFTGVVVNTPRPLFIWQLRGVAEDAGGASLRTTRGQLMEGLSVNLVGNGWEKGERDGIIFFPQRQGSMENNRLVFWWVFECWIKRQFIFPMNFSKLGCEAILNFHEIFFYFTRWHVDVEWKETFFRKIRFFFVFVEMKRDSWSKNDFLPGMYIRHTSFQPIWHFFYQGLEPRTLGCLKLTIRHVHGLELARASSETCRAFQA